MIDHLPIMVRIGDSLLRATDVSHMKWERGHSYTNLRITMRDGQVYVVRDWQGSAYDAERRLLAAIEHYAALAPAGHAYAPQSGPSGSG